VPDYSISVQVDEPFQDSVAAEAVRRAALATLLHQEDSAHSGPGELTVVITGDDQIQELNRRFLGHDRPTDVLAFADDTRGPFAALPGLPRYLGDVIISCPRAAAQATEAGHAAQAELQLLVVHGVLHLLGHDDREPRLRAAMWAAQAAILQALGVQANLPE
jgi:probable rRNA maturation factor